MLRTLTITVAMIGATIAPLECEPPARTCDHYAPLLDVYAPEAGWSGGRMSRIMWRESRCDPHAYNSAGRAAGLLQITPVSYPYLRDALGEWVDRWTLMDPEQNVRAAAALFDYWSRAGRSGYQPWSL